KVLLLEAGGFDLSSQSQDVYEGKSIGPLEYFGVSACRLRMFGGTSNHWSGRCGVFERLDFEPRDIWGVPGWPISYDEAYRRLDDAREILDIADQSLARRSEPQWKDARFLPAGFARSAPTRFGEKYRSELEASKLIDVALNANAIGATFAENGGAVTSLIVTDYRNRKFSIEADHFVLAFGAIENARFLLNLAENSGVPVGNAGGYVGGCFMEHFDIKLGRFATFNASLWDRDESFGLNANEALTRRRRLGTAVVNVEPAARPKFYGRLAPFRRLANSISCAADDVRPSGRAERTTLCLGDGLVSTILEQTPNPDSRVVLDKSARDQFGQFRIAVDWRVSGQDVATITGLAEEIGKAFAEQNVARLQISDDIRAGRPRPGFHCHQMGTTRMSSSPKDGVVDADLKVHGMRNLHIAGASVYPTGGGINPTLTLTCLALRLGEHLATRISGA
ncbi:MAG: GMC oxidoreductase, partial [Pseudomonadota bacterium]